MIRIEIENSAINKENSNITVEIISKEKEESTSPENNTTESIQPKILSTEGRFNTFMFQVSVALSDRNFVEQQKRHLKIQGRQSYKEQMQKNKDAQSACSTESDIGQQFTLASFKAFRSFLQDALDSHMKFRHDEFMQLLSQQKVKQQSGFQRNCTDGHFLTLIYYCDQMLYKNLLCQQGKAQLDPFTMPLKITVNPKIELNIEFLKTLLQKMDSKGAADVKGWTRLLHRNQKPKDSQWQDLLVQKKTINMRVLVRIDLDISNFPRDNWQRQTSYDNQQMFNKHIKVTNQLSKTDNKVIFQQLIKNTFDITEQIFAVFNEETDNGTYTISHSVDTEIGKLHSKASRKNIMRVELVGNDITNVSSKCIFENELLNLLPDIICDLQIQAHYSKFFSSMLKKIYQMETDIDNY